MRSIDVVRGAVEYRQKKDALASFAENELPYPPIGREAAAALKSGLISDLNEGHAPYRPRYILPEYAVLMRDGSEYLDLQPPRDLYEAVDALLIAYSYVPSITGYPVYLGDVDKLLEPFVATVSEKERECLLRLFLTHIDRAFPDAFVHMDLGPEDSVIGRDIIRLSASLGRAVPNLSLRFSADTPDSLAVLAATAALAVGKPYFVNHEALLRDLGPDYAVASCYNTLRRGGGSHTLVRLSLKELASRSRDLEGFLASDLPAAVNSLVQIVNARARFVVEEAKFFEHSFLAREDWIRLDKFTSMAAIYGLYEAVERLTGSRMGESDEADEVALRITEASRDLVKSYEGAWCEGYGGKLGFHAQSGIDTDVDVTPGVRVKYGREAPLARQLTLEGRLHGYFDAGVSEIAVFDKSAKANPEGVVSVARGAMKSGIKVFSVIGGDSEMIRITGYLVKRSDVEKRRKGQALREGTVALGADSLAGGHILERRQRVLD